MTIGTLFRGKRALLFAGRRVPKAENVVRVIDGQNPPIGGENWLRIAGRWIGNAVARFAGRCLPDVKHALGVHLGSLVSIGRQRDALEPILSEHEIRRGKVFWRRLPGTALLAGERVPEAGTAVRDSGNQCLAIRGERRART